MTARPLIWPLALTALLSSSAASGGDFEVLFSGTGQIRSFTYFHPGSDNFIDTIVALESETIRYRSSYLVFRFEGETDMGQGAQPGMPFDPNRGRWMFGVGARTELAAHFIEGFVRHDCYHGIDRYLPGQDFKMSSIGVAFGSRDYLQKYRYQEAARNAGSIRLPLRFTYYLAPSIYVPRSAFWQRSPYRTRLEADARLDLFQWQRLGFGVELQNVFYFTGSSTVERTHQVNLDVFLFGDSHALLLFAGWWPYDDQQLRNRSGRTVAGLELSF